jgi:hypothetical protein
LDSSAKCSAFSLNNFIYVVSRDPVAKIEPSHTITGEELPAPKVAAFSSRGPSFPYPEFIKVIKRKAA